MLKRFFPIVFFLFVAFSAASAQDAPNPVKWSLSLEKSSALSNKDDEFKADLSAQIEKGWHLYALEKIDDGPLPTKISIADDSPFELGKINAPPPTEVDDPAFGITTKFYEEAVKFVLSVKAADKFESGKSALKIKVRFQSCNDQMCLPPKTVILSSDSEPSPN